MFGLRFLGPLGMVTMGDGRPDNSQADASSLSKLYEQVRAQNRTPNGRVARGFNAFGPVTPVAGPAPEGYGQPPMSPNQRVAQGFDAVGDTPLQTAMKTPAHLPVPQAPAPTQAPAQPVPLPTPRPAEAPEPPQEMSFFLRNALMQRDPSTGAFLDPTSAERAQASGPSVIQKLLDMFHSKDT